MAKQRQLKRSGVGNGDRSKIVLQGAPSSKNLLQTSVRIEALLFRIGLFVIVSRIQDREAALRLCRHLDVFTLALFFRVGDKHLRNMLPPVRAHSVVQFPHTFTSPPFSTPPPPTP